MRKIIDWIKDRDGMEWFIFISVTIVAIITILGLVGIWENESNRISTGTIIEKEYNDDYYTYVNKVLIHHDESYYFTIRGVKDEEMVEYYFEVDKTTYDNYSVGQVYP